MTHFQLSLHADKLPTGFLGRRPKPYAIVELDDGTRLGKTEIIHDPTVTPDWTVSMKLQFGSSARFPFTVTIFDWHGNREDRKLAEQQFEATEVFSSPGHMQMKEGRDGTQ